MKSEYHSNSSAYPRAIVAGVVFAVAAATLPGSAFAEASYDAASFASLLVTPDTGIVADGGAVDRDITDDVVTGNGVATIQADTVLAFDDFTLQDVGVSGSAGPGDGTSSAVVDTVTSLTFSNPTTSSLSIFWELDYLLSAIASIDNPALEAVGATASVLLGVFDFTTFEQTTLFEQSFELLGPGDLFFSTEGVPITGEIVVPGSGSVGFNVDVYADGLAISTVPVPAALVLFCSGFAGLLGMGLRRKTAVRLNT